jgi:PAS domain-containing protein
MNESRQRTDEGRPHKPLKKPQDHTPERILAELSEIRQNVMEIKHLAEDRILEEGLFQTLEYGSKMGIFVVQDGKFRFVNKHTENHWGYTLEEFIGRDAMSIVYPEDREMVRESSYRCSRDNDPPPSPSGLWPKMAPSAG